MFHTWPANRTDTVLSFTEGNAVVLWCFGFSDCAHWLVRSWDGHGWNCYKATGHLASPSLAKSRVSPMPLERHSQYSWENDNSVLISNRARRQVAQDCACSE